MIWLKIPVLVAIVTDGDGPTSHEMSPSVLKHIQW